MVQANTRVRDLKREIYDRISVRPDAQRLIYGGKPLTDNRMLADFHIEPLATLHCIISSPQSQQASQSSFYSPSTVSVGPSRPTGVDSYDPGVEKPVLAIQGRSFNQAAYGGTYTRIEMPFLSREETQKRMSYWWEKSAEGHFDDDTYIVDPVVHQCHLQYTEEFVVTGSEYFRCRGNYESENDSLSSFSVDSSLPANISRYLMETTPEGFSRSDPDMTSEDARQTRRILESLWKSYSILCRLLETFEKLKEVRFCTTFYSILVGSPNSEAAQLMRITPTDLEGLKTGLMTAMIKIFDRDPDGPKLVLMAFVATQCDGILSSLKIFETQNKIPILALCRMIVLLLDLALVSYVGSHGSPFPSYVRADCDSIEIRDENGNIPPLRCTLRSLACLDEFLGSTKVWVFHWDSDNTTYLSRKFKRLHLLTRMAEFADIWGPVWAVPAGEANSTAIRQYNLSRGYIRPVAGGALDDVVRCHWYESSFVSQQNVSKADPGSEDSIFMNPNDLLSIGAALGENDQCQYTYQDYENDYGHSMGFLGTVSESWRLDSRTLGFQRDNI